MSQPSLREAYAVPVWICSIVVAGGVGARMGRSLPKQLEVVKGKRILDWSVEAMKARSDHVVVVAHPDLIDDHAHPLADAVVAGGATRTASVQAGLHAAKIFDPTHVLIHDAARPAVPLAVIDRVIDALTSGDDAAIPVVEVTDSLRTVDGVGVDRSKYCAVQTPQGFDFQLIQRAHASGREATDDAWLVDAIGVRVAHVAGDAQNIKVTVAADLARAAILLG